jgi:hypothetical protein
MIWTNAKKARCRRVIEACAQASSIGFGLTALVPVASAVAVLLGGLLSGNAWLAAGAAGALAAAVIGVILALGPLHEPVRRLILGARFKRVAVRTVLKVNGHHTREVEYDIKIVRTGVRRIADRYCCLGPTRDVSRRLDRSPSPSTPSHAPRIVRGGASVMGPLWDTAEACWHFLVDFGSPLASGTTRTISIEHTIDWSHLDYAPRIQRTVLDPTDELELRLQFPGVDWPSESRGEELVSSRKARDLTVTRDAERKELIMVVSKPRIGHTYRIRWNGSRVALGAALRDIESGDGPTLRDERHNAKARAYRDLVNSRISRAWSRLVVRGGRLEKAAPAPPGDPP